MSELNFEDLAPLARLERAGLNESFHLGVAVALDRNGQILTQLGNIDKLIYPRSSVKPIQALVMQELGLNLSGVELVLSMASHQGTEEHQLAVESILTSHGLSAKDLLCPRAFPGNPNARAKANSASRLAMNCSGKHAGFLATCSVNGWDTKDYLNPSHPLQQRILQRVEELSGEKISKITADGCGAPLFALTTIGLARAMQGFGLVGQQLMNAAFENPWAIGDHGSADAVFLEHGHMAKIGAEGVFVVLTPNNESIAVKIADGNLRAAPVVALELLKRNGLVAESSYRDILTRVSPKVLGGDSETGSLLVAF